MIALLITLVVVFTSTHGRSRIPNEAEKSLPTGHLPASLQGTIQGS